MYHTIVRYLARKSFNRLSEGDYEYFLRLCSKDVVHTFRGAPNALAGTRRGQEMLRRWLERVMILFKGLRFTLFAVSSSGWPWNTVVFVEWTDRTTARDGEPYVNDGVHVIRMRWGKAVSITAYNDSASVERTLARMAKAGVAEASMLPIQN
jgi:ketosteroid isomerase-like protein